MEKKLLTLFKQFDRQPRLVRWTMLVTITGLIGGLDYWTGSEASISPLYMIPIVLAAWSHGLGGGFFFAFASSTTLVLSNHLAAGAYTVDWIPIWNILVRGSVYAALAYFVASYRSLATIIFKMAMK